MGLSAPAAASSRLMPLLAPREPANRFFGLAGDRRHLIAKLRQQFDCYRADATRSAGYQYWAGRGRHAGLLKLLNAFRCGEPCSTDDHAGMQGQTGRTFDRPICGNTNTFSKTTRCSHAKIKSDGNDFIAHRERRRGWIPSTTPAASIPGVCGKLRVTPGYLLLTTHLEIQRGKFHLYKQFACRQFAFLTTDDTATESLLVFSLPGRL